MIESRSRAKRSVPPDAPERSFFDNAGHLDPLRAERLLELGSEGRTKASELAFVDSERESDDLAEELGEGAVFAMTTGEDVVSDDFNRDVEEDWGGPFVETTASTEFASGTDESNIAEATREPFPTV